MVYIYNHYHLKTSQLRFSWFNVHQIKWVLFCWFNVCPFNRLEVTLVSFFSFFFLVILEELNKSNLVLIRYVRCGTGYFILIFFCIFISVVAQYVSNRVFWDLFRVQWNTITNIFGEKGHEILYSQIFIYSYLNILQVVQFVASCVVLRLIWSALWHEEKCIGRKV